MSLNLRIMTVLPDSKSSQYHAVLLLIKMCTVIDAKMIEFVDINTS